MGKKNNRLMRSFDPFKKELESLSKERFIKGLSKEKPSISEMQELLMRSDGFKMSKEELKRKPKKEDLRF